MRPIFVRVGAFNDKFSRCRRRRRLVAAVLENCEKNFCTLFFRSTSGVGVVVAVRAGLSLTFQSLKLDRIVDFELKLSSGLTNLTNFKP